MAHSPRPGTGESFKGFERYPTAADVGFSYRTASDPVTRDDDLIIDGTIFRL